MRIGQPLETTSEGARDDVAATEPLTRFSSVPEEVVGRVLDGRYAIESVLGQGAMAVVLGARHTFLGTRVAVKVLHPLLSAVPEMRARFVREARVTSQVAHPGLVRVSDFGVSAEGLHYLVMEHLTGEDLLAWSERRGQASARECREIAVAVCGALQALHEAGYVHRDLKPENLWVSTGADGSLTVKVLDLGIAGLVESAHDGRAERLTRAGQTLGTALYMSPEQAMGNPLDARSDLYALGIVLWELATAETAFAGDTPLAIMRGHIAHVPPPPSTLNPTLPPWFDRLVERLMAKKPEDRFQSAAETARAFLEAGDRPADTAEAKVPIDRADEDARRDPRRWLPWVVAGVAAGAVAALLASRGEPDATTTTTRERAVGLALASHGQLGETAQLSPATAAQPDPVPETVRLVFAIEPKGTRVLRDGREIGVSPFVVDVPMSDARQRYVLEAEGRLRRTIEVAHDADRVVQETLPKIAVSSPRDDKRGDGATATRTPEEEPPADGLWQPARPSDKDVSP